VTGCSRVSAGCANCWAEKIHNARFAATWPKKPQQYKKAWNEIQLHPDRLLAPLRWSRPEVVGLNLNGDLFHEDVPDEFLDQVYGMMLACYLLGKGHVFMCLTKRPARIREYLDVTRLWEWVEAFEAMGERSGHCGRRRSWGRRSFDGFAHRVPNFIPGISAENQEAWDLRAADLCQTRAAGWFVSLEPLLGPISMQLRPDGANCRVCGDNDHQAFACPALSPPGKLSLVVVGGESGKEARPARLEWVRDLRDQAVVAGVPFYFKQWGESEPCERVAPGLCRRCGDRHVVGGPRPMIRVGKRAATRNLDGREWNQFPVTWAETRETNG
jgi:protein gp37